MVTFIIIAPTGVDTILPLMKSIAKNSSGGFEIILCLNDGCPALDLFLKFAEEFTKKMNLPVHVVATETRSFTAKVNYCVSVARTPFVCAVNEGMILENEEGKLEDALIDSLHPYSDTLTVSYLYFQESELPSSVSPIFSRRMSELLGYAYHPICAVPKVCEDWIGSVFDALGRVQYVKGFRFANSGIPCVLNDRGSELYKEAQNLFTLYLGNMRNYTSQMLMPYLLPTLPDLSTLDNKEEGGL